MVPAEVHLISEMPSKGPGKVDRELLRMRAITAALIEHVPFFRNASSEFLRDLIPRLDEQELVGHLQNVPGGTGCRDRIHGVEFGEKPPGQGGCGNPGRRAQSTLHRLLRCEHLAHRPMEHEQPHGRAGRSPSTRSGRPPASSTRISIDVPLRGWPDTTTTSSAVRAGACGGAWHRAEKS